VNVKTINYVSNGIGKTPFEIGLKDSNNKKTKHYTPQNKDSFC